MKGAMLLVVLMVLAARAAVLENARSDSNLEIGEPQPDDVILDTFTVWHFGSKIEVTIDKPRVYPEGTTITAISATEVGPTQYSTASVFDGGIGTNTVTLRFQLAAGWSLHYNVIIWGRMAEKK